MVEQGLLQRAVREIPKMLGEWLQTEAEVRKVSSESFDFLLVLDDLAFAAEVKGRAGVAEIETAASQLRSDQLELISEPQSARPLLIVPYMSNDGREKCRKLALSWIDLSGNAEIRVSDARRLLLVSIEGKPNLYSRKGRPKNVFAPKAARLTRCLLQNPERAFTQRDLSQATGLDEGYVSRLVSRMMNQELLIKEGDFVRPKDYRILLEAWEESNPYRHGVINGHVPGRSGEERAKRLLDALTSTGVVHSFTGLAAAWAYTKVAGFRHVACYAKGMEALEKLAVAGFREDSAAPNVRLLIPDDDGVLDYGGVVGELQCVSPVQVIIDLRNEPERAEEFSEAMKRKYFTSLGDVDQNVA